MTRAIDAISTLKTVRGQFSTAYLMNGSRGQGTLQIGVASMEYWIASSDPARDEHIRQLALRETQKRSWSAMRLLVDDEWQEAIAVELELAA